MTPEKPSLLKKECLHQGFLKVERLTYRQHRFDGGTMDVAREVMLRQPVVIVHTYDPQTQQVVLVEQCRPGPIAAGDDQTFIFESPAGIIDDGEQPLEAAGRELGEETGLTAIRLTQLVSGYVSPGGSSAYAYHVLAEVSLNGFDGGNAGLADEHEDIRVHVMPLQAALEKAKAGGIRSQHTLIGLYHLALQAKGLG